MHRLAQALRPLRHIPPQPSGRELVQALGPLTPCKWPSTPRAAPVPGCHGHTARQQQHRQGGRSCRRGPGGPLGFPRPPLHRCALAAVRIFPSEHVKEANYQWQVMAHWQSPSGGTQVSANHTPSQVSVAHRRLAPFPTLALLLPLRGPCLQQHGSSSLLPTLSLSCKGLFVASDQAPQDDSPVPPCP